MNLFGLHKKILSYFLIKVFITKFLTKYGSEIDKSKSNKNGQMKQSFLIVFNNYNDY